MLRLAAGAERVDAFVGHGVLVGVRSARSRCRPRRTPRSGSPSRARGCAPRHPPPPCRRQLTGRRARDQLVLLGLTGLALVDRVTTPLGRWSASSCTRSCSTACSRAPCHAPALGAVARGRLLLTIGLAMIVLLPVRRLAWYAPAGLVLPLAFAAYRSARGRATVLVDALLPALGSSAVLVALLGGGLAEADAQRRRLRRELEAQRLSAARLAASSKPHGASRSAFCTPRSARRRPTLRSGGRCSSRRRRSAAISTISSWSTTAICSSPSAT